MSLGVRERLSAGRAAREGFGNSISSSYRGYITAIGIALSLFAPITSDALAIHRIALDESRYILAGATVQLINAPGQ